MSDTEEIQAMFDTEGYSRRRHVYVEAEKFGAGTIHHAVDGTIIFEQSVPTAVIKNWQVNRHRAISGPRPAGSNNAGRWGVTGRVIAEPRLQNPRKPRK